MPAVTPIRVRFVEPSLAAYRVPFFRQLAATPGLNVSLSYAESGRVNATPDGFAATLGPRRVLRALGHPIYWQPAQLASVDRRIADVVSFDWDVHYASLVPALLKAKRHGVATILWGHGTSRNDGSWKAWPRQSLARLADVLVTYAEPARQRYLAAGWPVTRVFCAPNAIDQSPIQTAYAALREAGEDESRVIAAARQRLALPAAGPVLLFVSRLDAIRRLDVLIDAAALVTSRWPGVAVAIVGAGGERGSIEAHAARVGVHAILAGAVYEERALADWYAAADVVVHPAGLGLSVYHAMGHGRPIVTGDDPFAHGPEATAVIDGETGFRFAHNDARACADAIARLLDDSTLRARLGTNARARATREHTMDAMVSAFEAAIRAACRYRDA